MNTTAAQMPRHKTDQLVRELAAVLGAPLVAVIAGVRDTRSVRQWMSNQSEPRDKALVRLRTAMQIVDILRLSEEPDVIKAWFAGLNPLLDDQNPARLVGTGDEADWRRVIHAARRYVSE